MAFLRGFLNGIEIIVRDLMFKESRLLAVFYYFPNNTDIDPEPEP